MEGDEEIYQTSKPEDMNEQQGSLEPGEVVSQATKPDESVVEDEEKEPEPIFGR